MNSHPWAITSSSASASVERGTALTIRSRTTAGAPGRGVLLGLGGPFATPPLAASGATFASAAAPAVALLTASDSASLRALSALLLVDPPGGVVLAAHPASATHSPTTAVPIIERYGQRIGFASPNPN